MKTIKHAAIACCAMAGMMAATSTHASEDNHFAGGYVVLSQDWKSASATVDGEKIKKSEAAPSIGLGYTFAVDKHATVGVKATFDTKKGEYGVGETALGETELKEKSHYSIAVEPGYAIRDDLLVFGILAYHKANTELIATGATKGTGSLNGFGYGVGAKLALPNHWFLMGEIQKVDYRSKMVAGSEVKPSSTVLALGLGYHF